MAERITDSEVSQRPHSYLEKGIDCLTSPFITNEKLRENVDHYAGQFIKTASLFTGGKLGLAGAVVSYGLDQASPDTTVTEQVEDFALGATKGVAMKGLFQAVGTKYTFAPTKGALIGIGSRGLEDLLQRDTFADPSKGLQRLTNDVLNPQSIMFDAAVWTLGQGAFGAANRFTGGSLMRNPLVGGMAMGSTFGVVSGGAGEIMREKMAGEKFDLSKVAQRGLMEGLISGAAAGTGMKLTEMQMPRFVSPRQTEDPSANPRRSQGQGAQSQTREGSDGDFLVSKKGVVSLDELGDDPLTKLSTRIREQKLSLVSTKPDAPMATNKDGFEVVLGASGAETTAHIGFLKALEEKQVPISKITGASGGSLAATFYANGYSAAEMKDIFLSDEFRNTSPQVLAECLHLTDPWNLWPYAMDFKPWLQDVIGKYDLKPQPSLRIVAADAATHEPVVFEGKSYDLATALAASTAATPAMGLKPVMYNGRTLIDGFYYHPIPAALAKNPPAIVSKIGATTLPPSEMLTPWDYFMHMKEMLGSAEQARNYPDPPGNIIATTGLPDVSMTAFGISKATLEKLIDHGYQATTERLEQPDAVAALQKRGGTEQTAQPIKVTQSGSGRTTALLEPGSK